MYYYNRLIRLVALVSLSAVAMSSEFNISVEAAEKVATLQTPPLWHFGTNEEDPVLGAVVDMTADTDGTVYLLDYQLCHVVVIDASGRYLRTIGGKGDGPGETRAPDGLFLSDGRIGIVQGAPSRVVMFDRNGNGVGDLTLPDADSFRSSIDVRRYCSGSLYMGQRLIHYLEGGIKLEDQIVRASMDGMLERVLWEQARESSSAGMQFAEGTHPVWDVSVDGRLYVSADYDDYRILILDAYGLAVKTIKREYESLAYSDEEMAARREHYEELWRLVGQPDRALRQNKRDILALRARDNGELWVRTSLGAAGSNSSLGAFDVFDKEGEYHHVIVDAPFDSNRDLWYIVGDRLYITRNSISAIQNVFSRGEATTEPYSDDESVPEIWAFELGFVMEAAP